MSTSSQLHEENFKKLTEKIEANKIKRLPKKQRLAKEELNVSNLKSVFFVILASYNHGVYEHMIEMRRQQLKKYNVPYIFVIDGELGGRELKDDEIYFERTKEIEQKTRIAQKLPKDAPVETCNMLFKFQDALILLKDRHPQITHILRLDVSTFVNMKLLSKSYGSLPKEKSLLGNGSYGSWSPFDKSTKDYLSGTAIMLSMDVVEQFCRLDIRKNIYSYLKSDDVSLCWLLSDDFKQRVVFSRFDFDPSFGPSCDEYKNSQFICVKNDDNREIVDLNIWKKLLYELDNILYK
jgi:hypothetical protein